MQLLIDGTIYLSPPGGISRYFDEILPRMCQMEPTMWVRLFTDQAPRQPLPEHQQITHQKLFSLPRYLRPSRVWKPALPTLQKIAHCFTFGSGQDTIWHSTYFTAPIFWQGKQVVTVHDMLYELFPTLFQDWTSARFRVRKKKAVLQADAILCNSATTRQDLQAIYGLSASNIYMTHLGYSEVFHVKDNSEALLPLPVQHPFLLYVGRRSGYKNFQRLLEAYSRWSQRQEIALVVASTTDWQTEEERQLSELGIQEHVYKIANASDELLAQLYNQAAAFIYPSLYEGFGIPLLEAMACGCPIVASRIPSTLEIAADIPIYFEASEVDSLLAALEQIVVEGRNSPRTIKGLTHVTAYSWDRTARQTLDVYQTLA